MPEKKILAVVGATAGQGGGLVDAILDDPGGGFAARALTRNASSEAARALERRGAEVRAADIDDEESLRRAFAGAYGAFCLTFHTERSPLGAETVEAGNMARAARKAGLRHVIWSTLEDTRKWIPPGDPRMPTLMGKYKVPHLDSKGEGDRFFLELDLPVTRLLTSFNWENFIRFGMGPARGPDGSLGITFPMGDRKLPGIAVRDVGRCAYAIFRRGGEFAGKTVGIAGEQPTLAGMAAAFTKALGREVRYNDVPPDVFRSFGFPGAVDIGNMFQFIRDCNEDFCAARSVAASRELHPGLETFESWLGRNKEAIPVG